MDNLNNIPSSGNFGDVADKLNDNFNKVNIAVETINSKYVRNKGYFPTLAALQAAFPSPKIGDTAYVANVASSSGYYIANVVGGAWAETTTVAPAMSINANEYAKHGYSTAPKTLKQVDDKIIQLANDLSEDLNSIIYDFDAKGIVITSFTDALNKTLSIAKENMVLRGTTTSGTYFNKIFIKKDDTPISTQWYNTGECWHNVVPTNNIIGVLNLSNKVDGNPIIYDSKVDARNSIPSGYAGHGLIISYILKYNGINVNVLERKIPADGSLYPNDDMYWEEISSITFPFWKEYPYALRRISGRKLNNALKDIWFNKDAFSDIKDISFRSYFEDREIPIGLNDNKSLSFHIIHNDDTLTNIYFGWNTPHNRDDITILEMKSGGIVYGYVALHLGAIAGTDAYNALPSYELLSRTIFDVNNTTILRDSVKKYIEGIPSELPVPIADSRYAMIQADNLTITNANAKSIQYYLDGKMYYEPYLGSKTLTGRLALVRLFNFELPEKYQADLLRMMPTDKLGSEYYQNSIDVTNNSWLTVTGGKKNKWCEVSVTVNLISNANATYWVLGARLADNTLVDIIPYGLIPSDIVGRTIKIQYLSGNSPVARLELNYYNSSHAYMGSGMTYTLRYMDLGVIESYSPNTITDNHWIDAADERIFIDITSLKKYARMTAYSNIQDAYLYGIDKILNVGGVSYCKSGNNGDISDLTQISPSKKPIVGTLQPVEVIQLLDKRYLGCWNNKHYSVNDTTKIIYSSNDGVTWQVLWDTQGVFGKIWHLVANDSGRVIIATQAAASSDGIYVSDVNGANFVKKLTFTATAGSTVSTYQDIQAHGNIVLLNEYDSGAYGNRLGAKVWMSKDYGETFKIIFDGHKHEKVTSVAGSAGYNHIHGAFYDKYWDRVWVCCGDRELSGLLWSDSYWNRTGDETDTYSDYKFVRYNSGEGDTIHKAKGVPQPIAGFAMPNAVFFGTDAYPNGFFATLRDSKDNPTFQRVCQIGDDKNTITCIPRHYHQLKDGRPCYVSSGVNENSTELYNSVYATYDGINFTKVWEDNILKSTAGVTITLEEAYCWDDNLGNTWVYTKGYDDVSRKLIKCRQL